MPYLTEEIMGRPKKTTEVKKAPAKIEKKEVAPAVLPCPECETICVGGACPKCNWGKKHG